MNCRYVGRTPDGRLVYANERGGLVRFATPEAKQASPRRSTFCVYADGSTRQPRVGMHIVGRPIYMQRINYPRRRTP